MPAPADLHSPRLPLPSRLSRGLLAGLLATATIAGTAYVRVEQENGTWSFANESGKFLSLGINSIRMREYWEKGERADARKRDGYYDVRARFTAPYDDWAASVKQRMAEWGFNTVGAWSSNLLQQKGVLYCHLLELGWSGHPNPLVDLFNPGFEDYADRVARRECTKRADDANLVGYFLDNELPWYGRKAWRTGRDSLLNLYSELPGDAPGRARLVAFLQARYGDWNSFANDFSTSATSWAGLARAGEIKANSKAAQPVELAWAGEVAERFYAVTAAAIRRHDPHHLLLGSRFAGNAPAEVWQAAAAHCDVLSVNYYPAPGKPALERWREIHAQSGKPLLISETSLRAMQNGSHNRNSVGSGSKVDTQQERADAMAALLDAWLHEPYLVGIHWFEYADQPPGGRGHNGENSNYGLVDIHDQPYGELLAAWRHAAQSRPGAPAVTP